MLLLPFFWMMKFSGVLHERNGELTLLKSKADKNKNGGVKGSTWVQFSPKSARWFLRYGNLMFSPKEDQRTGSLGEGH